MTRDVRQGTTNDARQFCHAVSTKEGKLAPDLRVRQAYISGPHQIYASLQAVADSMSVSARFTLAEDGDCCVNSVEVWQGPHDEYNLVPIMDRLDNPELAVQLRSLLHQMRDRALVWLVLNQPK